MKLTEATVSLNLPPLPPPPPLLPPPQMSARRSDAINQTKWCDRFETNTNCHTFARASESVLGSQRESDSTPNRLAAGNESDTPCALGCSDYFLPVNPRQSAELRDVFGEAQNIFKVLFIHLMLRHLTLCTRAISSDSYTHIHTQFSIALRSFMQFFPLSTLESDGITGDLRLHM